MLFDRLIADVYSRASVSKPSRWEARLSRLFCCPTAGTNDRHHDVSRVNHSCRRIASNSTLPKGALHVMTLMRTTAGINKTAMKVLTGSYDSPS